MRNFLEVDRTLYNHEKLTPKKHMKKGETMVSKEN